MTPEIDLRHGDALTILRTLPDGCVNTCVTSPPYFGLRDYGVAGQMGLEPTPAEYVTKMVELFREVRRVLRDDGTLWLNLGDSYSSGASGQQRRDNKGGVWTTETQRRLQPSSKRPPSAAGSAGWLQKNLLGIPWRVAFGLQDDGWILRQDIIWAKPNAMPESVTDRCTKSHEYIFLLSKSARYHFDHRAIREPAICGHRGSEFHTGKTAGHQLGRAQKVRPSAPKGSFKAKGQPLPGQLPFRAVVDFRNKRSVWRVATKAFSGAHFATFPPDLIRPCILAGAPKDGLVLDPFTGSGTTGMVAIQEGRRFVGIELNADYLEMARTRIASAVEKRPALL